MTAYCDLIDLFYHSDVAPVLSFRCLVVAKSDDVSQTAGKTEKDLGFFKAYYTLLSKRLKPGTDNHITIDERTSPRPRAVEELGERLNWTGGREKPPFRVASCKMARSKDDDLLQLADVLCGAVAWAYNGMQSTCGAKPILHERMCRAMNWITLEKCETDAKAPKFNVWPYRPRKR
jgi:hypothetical protein